MDGASVKSNEKKFFEYVNLKDIKAMADWIENFLSEDFINHNPTLGVPNNREGLIEMFSSLFKLFPKISFTIKEIVFENDILCFRYNVYGIRENEKLTGIAMVKFKNGKITDRWAMTESI